MVLTVVNFLAILSLVALVAAVVLFALLFSARLGPRAAHEPGDVAETLYEWWVPLAWVVAATAMGGSLFLSEVAGFVPCALCWYQRIAMYPQALILLVATVRGRDDGIRPYAIALSGVGALIAAYHIVLQRIPGLPSGSCSLQTPCTTIYVEVFGFVTIPVMAFSGFLLILALALASRRGTEELPA